MYETVVDSGISLVAQYGLVVLLIAFVLEGALVGKLIPTRALFVAAALVVGSDAVGLAAVAAVAVVGATLGQAVLFVAVRRTDCSVESLPGPTDAAGGAVVGWFDRWGLPAVAVSNALPVARGSLTVPVAMTDESVLRFCGSSVLGSSVYAGGLVAVAAGIDVLFSLL